jgi:HlyD family secretion protein
MTSPQSDPKAGPATGAGSPPNAAAATPLPRLRLGLLGPGLAGLAGLLLLVLVFGGWATLTRISGAVIAGGEVMVQGRPKLVQSLDGGIVAEIAVRDGDHVAAGQLLLRLDPTLLRTNLDIARSRLAAGLALKARLEVEQAGLDHLGFRYPPLPFARPDTTEEEAGQRRIFEARRAVTEGARARLGERLAQFDSQIAGTAGQIAALRDQIGFIEADLSNQENLAAQGLARQSQVSDLMRRRAELQGQLAALEAEKAGLANARQDAEIETLQAERAFTEQVVTDLRATTSEVEELVLDIITRSAQLDRTEIRAPADGVVNELQVTTLGGVVSPGQTIVQVVPIGQGMEFELRVDPRAIDQIHPGQKARLMISSFDPQTTPRLEATVATVSAGAIVDPKTGHSYYRVGLMVPTQQLARLEGAVLMPGMPVEAYLETTERSVLAYLLQPVTSHMRRAFRE